MSPQMEWGYYSAASPFQCETQGLAGALPYGCLPLSCAAVRPTYQEANAMLTLIGLSGSLRRDSYNSAVLRAAASMMPPDSLLRIESLAAIPLYNADDESASGIPAAVTQLKEAIAAADGLLLVSPEYNNSIAGMAKNAFDWLSRPPGDTARVFGGKPVALAGASPGGFGTILAQAAWLPMFRNLGADLWPAGRLLVSHASNVIDASGNISDAATRDNLAKFLTGFVAYVRQRRPR
jgi:NAD(P)H-dependent FMN reductase